MMSLEARFSENLLYTCAWKIGNCTWRAGYMEFFGKLHINSFPPGQNIRHFADDISRWIFLNENVWISMKISLNFVPKGSINNITALVYSVPSHYLNQCSPDSLTHMCGTRGRWVKRHFVGRKQSHFHQIHRNLFQMVLSTIYHIFRTKPLPEPMMTKNSDTTLRQVPMRSPNPLFL